MKNDLAYGYSSESTQRELSNVYQCDWVWVFFKNLRVFMLWTKVASALEGLNFPLVFISFLFLYSVMMRFCPHTVFNQYPVFLGKWENVTKSKINF